MSIKWSRLGIILPEKECNLVINSLSNGVISTYNFKPRTDVLTDRIYINGSYKWIWDHFGKNDEYVILEDLLKLVE